MELAQIWLDPLDRIFFISASLGGMLVVVRLLLNLLGHHGDVDSGGMDGHMDGSMGDGAGEHPESSFRLLSVQGLMAFFLMFGLVGLALHRGSKTSEMIAILGAFAAGVATMMLVAKMFQMMMGLQSSGNINLRKAVGEIGTVYLQIPAEGGTGQVQISITDRFMVLDATSENRQPIKTGERIQVVDLIAGNVLIVKKI